VLQHGLIHLGEIRFLFFNSFRTVVGLMGNTRAVSRMPLAFIAISTMAFVGFQGRDLPMASNSILSPLPLEALLFNGSVK
jgi:hypothetical protein